MSAGPCPESCVEFRDQRPKVVLRDNRGRSEFRAENPRKRTIEVCKVDGCWIKNSTACDFLMLADENEAWLIELKGSDVAKALRQIHATLDALDAHLHPRVVHARVVPTRVSTPNIIPAEEVRLRKRLQKLGGDYRCQAQKMEERLA